MHEVVLHPPPGIRRKYPERVKIAENLVGYARKTEHNEANPRAENWSLIVYHSKRNELQIIDLFYLQTWRQNHIHISRIAQRNKSKQKHKIMQ